MTVWWCEYATMWLCDHVTMWHCDTVTLWHCDTVTMWQCGNVTILLCDYETVWQCDDLTMWLCDYLTVCDDVTSWQCDYVTVWKEGPGSKRWAAKLQNLGPGGHLKIQTWNAIFSKTAIDAQILPPPWISALEPLWRSEQLSLKGGVITNVEK